MATAGMVGTICGLYLTRPDGPPERLNDGLAAGDRERVIAPPGAAAGAPRRTFVVP